MASCDTDASTPPPPPLPYRYPSPVRWPASDRFLAEMQANPDLEAHVAPLFTPQPPDMDIIFNRGLAEAPRPVSEAALLPPPIHAAPLVSYCRAWPKFLIMGFMPAGTAARGFGPATDSKGSTRLIYFSELCAGPPGVVHTGCLDTAADTLCGEYTIARDGILRVTRSIQVKHRRSVALKSVVRYDVTVSEHGGAQQQDLRVRLRFLDPSDCSVVLLECTGLFAMINRPGSKQVDLDYHADLASMRAVGAERCWASRPATVALPSTLEGWWPATARAASAKLGSPALLGVAKPGGALGGARFGKDAGSAALVDAYQGQAVWDVYPSSPAIAPQFDFDPEAADQGAVLDRLLASPSKILRRLFCHELGAAPPTAPHRRLGLVAGVYVLSPLAMGPPGRAHGGAVITICTDVMGYLVHREGGGPLMSNTVSLKVEYLGATPLSAPVIAVSRMVDVDGRLATTKAVLWGAMPSSRFRILTRTAGWWREAQPHAAHAAHARSSQRRQLGGGTDNWTPPCPSPSSNRDAPGAVLWRHEGTRHAAFKAVPSFTSAHPLLLLPLPPPLGNVAVTDKIALCVPTKRRHDRIIKTDKRESRGCPSLYIIFVLSAYQEWTRHDRTINTDLRESTGCPSGGAVHTQPCSVAHDHCGLSLTGCGCPPVRTPVQVTRKAPV